MKAVVKTQKARGAELIEMDVPEPKTGEVLIRVIATAICGTDVHIYNWDPGAQVFIKNVPQVLGHEFAGEIVEIGEKVKKFKVGDYVSAETHFFCGKCVQCRNNQKHICKEGKILGLSCDGCFAEYFAVSEKVLWKNDPNLPPEIACLQEPLGNAVYCALGEDKDLKGKNVLIFGDGPTGLMACGVCKAEGASTVVLIGRHDARLRIARAMGADFVFNEITQSDIEFDVVLEMAGSKNSIEQAFRWVRKGGRISAFGIYGEPYTIENYGQFVRSGVKVLAISGRRIWQTWKEVSKLLNSGRLDISPIITHKLPLEEFEKGFDLMTKRPKVSGKVILYP